MTDSQKEQEMDLKIKETKKQKYKLLITIPNARSLA